MGSKHIGHVTVDMAPQLWGQEHVTADRGVKLWGQGLVTAERKLVAAAWDVKMWG